MSIDITDKVKYAGDISYDGDHLTSDNHILLEPRFHLSDDDFKDNLTLNTFVFNSQDIQNILPCDEWSKHQILILRDNKTVLNEIKINSFLNNIKLIINNMSLNDMLINNIIQFDNLNTFIFNYKTVQIKQHPCDSNTYDSNQILFYFSLISLLFFTILLLKKKYFKFIFNPRLTGGFYFYSFFIIYSIIFIVVSSFILPLI